MTTRERILPASRHGVVSALELVRHGWSRPDIRSAVAGARLRRLRPGWFAADGADIGVARAVTAGGHLSCVSALAHHGLWTPPDDRTIHVRLTEHAVGREPQTGVSFCSAPGPGGLLRWRDAVDPLDLALTAAGSCTSPEMFVAILDSAMHRRGFARDDVAELIHHASSPVHRLLDRCDRAESGTESLVRYRLQSRRIRLTPQVEIATVGRVDFVVGRRLVIEVDSKAHHTSSEAYHRDRRRDRRLVALGYLVIRLAYEDVVHRWHEVEPDLLAIIRSGVHLAPPLG